jgi:hypothetical protein
MVKSRPAPTFGRDLKVYLAACSSDMPACLLVVMARVTRNLLLDSWLRNTVIQSAGMCGILSSHPPLVTAKGRCYIHCRRLPRFEGCHGVQELCSTSKIPVFRDCISFLTKPRDGKKPAYCLEGLFKSASTDRKVNLLRQAYQLGRNPLRMLALQDPFAVSLCCGCCCKSDSVLRMNTRTETLLAFAGGRAVASMAERASRAAYTSSAVCPGD